jgi:flagellar biosynthesis/type III secretory pathway M-ring protein FliF/YscJ
MIQNLDENTVKLLEKIEDLTKERRLLRQMCLALATISIIAFIVGMMI